MTDDTNQPTPPPPPRSPEPTIADGGTGRHLDLDLLIAYQDGELNGAERRAAAAHLGACPDCRRELAELRATRGLLGGLPHYAPRRPLTLGPEHARRPTGADRLRQFPTLLPPLRAATAAVAALLLLVSVGGFVADRDAADRSAIDQPASDFLEEAPGQPIDGGAAIEQEREEESAAPTEPMAAMPAVAPQEAPTDAEAAEDAFEAAAPQAASDQVATDEVAGDEAAGEAAPSLGRAAATEAVAVAPAPATLIPGAAPVDGAARSPSPVPTPAAIAPTAESAAAADSAPAVSGWRRAQIGLGLLLVPLLVALIALEWHRFRTARR